MLYKDNNSAKLLNMEDVIVQKVEIGHYSLTTVTIACIIKKKWA